MEKMELRPTPVDLHAPVKLHEPLRNVAELLVGHGADVGELPPLGELVNATVSLATGMRDKVLLALREAPLEFALVRNDADVLVSWYETGSSPEVLLLNRAVPLDELMEACALAAEGLAAGEMNPTLRDIHLKLAERVAGTRIVPMDESRPRRVVTREGGTLEMPTEEVPVAFGFSAAIPTGSDELERASARADVHAMLFSGTLWAFMHGRRVVLSRGPILLAAQRMVAAAHALMDAWDTERAINVRLRAGAFHVGVRLDAKCQASLTLGPETKDSVGLTNMNPADVVAPILRLATDLCRTLVAADRGQARNLRIRGLRDEVRALRKRLRERHRADGFTNQDPERLRDALRSEPPAEDQSSENARHLRFTERWRVEINELDAGATFLCGDRIVISTPKRAVAVSRDNGAVLWVKEGAAASSLMAGRTLVRISPEGTVELCDVATGDTLAETQVRSRGTPFRGVFAGTASNPPALLLTENGSRVVSIDLRTGEHRWRFATRGPGPVQMARSGRTLVVTSGDGSVSAVDVHSGDVAWRVNESVRFTMAPAIAHETVVVCSGEPGSRVGHVYGIELFTGRVLWQRDVDAPPAGQAIASGNIAVLPVGAGRKASLAAFDLESGDLKWMIPDPGLGLGGDGLFVDQTLIVNAPSGRIAAINLADGSIAWSHKLSHPVADDVPRRLEPILRGGALFVPASKVHVLRPHDGSTVGNALPCDLVPDWIRVDERGWVYVAEESGILTAHAPMPHLSLVVGGRS